MYQKPESAHLTPAGRRSIFWCTFAACVAAVVLTLAALALGFSLQRRRQDAQTEQLYNILSARLSAAAGEAYAPDEMPELFLFDPVTEVLYPLGQGQTGSVGPYSLEITASADGYTLRLARPAP